MKASSWPSQTSWSTTAVGDGRRGASPGVAPTEGTASQHPRGDEDQEDLGEDEVDEEERHAGDDHRLVDRLAHAGRRPACTLEPLVGGHDRGDQAEDGGLQLRLDDVGGLGEGR